MIQAFKLLGSISLTGGAKVKAELDGISKKAHETGFNFQAMGNGLRIAGGAIAGVGIALGAMGGALLKTGISYNAMAEQSEVAWTTLLGSSEKAQKQMKDIANFAKATPFETEHVDQMAKYLHNAGLEGKGMFDELMKVSDVASAFAIPAHEAKEMTRQMAQVRNAGVAYTEDLNILEDKGVPIMKTIAKQLGITTAEAKKMASDGKISSEIYLNAFNEIAGGVKGASKAQSETFNGMISSLSDGAKMLAGALTERIFEKAKGFLTTINNIVGELVTVVGEGGSLKEVLNVIFPENVSTVLADAINGVIDAFKWIKDNWTLIVSALTGITTAFMAFHIITGITKAFAFFNAMMIAFRIGTVQATLAQWGFNTALLANPLTWIAIAIGVLVGAIIYLWLNWDKVSKWLSASWKTIKKVASDVWNGITQSMGIAGKAISLGWKIVKDKVSQAWDNMKKSATDKFNAIKDKAGTAFTEAKNKIMNPIKEAYEKIKGWIDKIKGFFTNLKLKIPKVSLPSLPKFSLNTSSKTIMGKKVTYPTGFGVKWNAQGGVFNRPTLFGAGEAGKEALVPLEGKHMFPMAQAITKYLAQNAIDDSRRNRAVEIPLYLDGREIARAIAPRIDQALGTIARRTARAKGVNPL
jgi:tape measure domain-containing protein